jgi:hypothetical protein
LSGFFFTFVFMFEPIKELCNKIINTPANRVVKVSLLAKNVQDVIIELNTIKQLYERGINADGVSLASVGGNYAPLTMFLSEKKGQPKRGSNHVDLYDTGDFYKSFKVIVYDDYFEIDADTQKDTNDLIIDWGEEILGLTEQSKEVLTTMLIDLLPNIIRNEWGL